MSMPAKFIHTAGDINIRRNIVSDSIKSLPLAMDDKYKYEAAEELGLLDKVVLEGWGSLSSMESGKIGGIVRRKKREDNR